MRRDGTGAAVLMVLFTAIGLFTIPLLPWMTMSSSSESTFEGDTRSSGHTESFNGTDEGENIMDDIGWITFTYGAMMALSLTAALGVVIDKSGFGPHVGYIGGGALAVAIIIIIIIHCVLFVHIAEYNDEYGDSDSDSFGGNSYSYERYYTIGLNLVPLVCAVLVILFSIKHLRSLR